MSASLRSVALCLAYPAKLEQSFLWPPERSALRKKIPTMATLKLDRIDRHILAIMQGDATRSLAHVAAEVGLSQTPCWRRIQRLRAAGVIERTVAILKPEAIGLGLTVFISIEAADHTPQWLKRFTELVGSRPEIVEAHRLAGDIDYLLKVCVADMAAYDAFYRALIAEISLKNVASRFAMERVKATTELPLEQL
jgi:Lrp/AsnC family transcriptional regulator